MIPNSSEEQAQCTAGPGKTAFAVMLVALGVLGIVKHDFTPLWNPVPDGVPARSLLVYLCAGLSLTSGIGLLWSRTAVVAARILLAGQLLWFLLLRIREVILSPTFGVFWPVFITAVFVAAAWVLYHCFSTEWDRRHLGLIAGNTGRRMARVLYGLSTIFFGLAHFIDPKDTLVLEPHWLPWHVFWVYFFGCTFIAAGIAVLIGLFARLAVALSVVQLALFTFLVWVPIVAAGSKNAFQWSETILSFALTAAAWVVAESYRGIPWLAINRR
jgi:uncharacterized membrane protein